MVSPRLAGTARSIKFAPKSTANAWLFEGGLTLIKWNIKSYYRPVSPLLDDLISILQALNNIKSFFSLSFVISSSWTWILNQTNWWFDETDIWKLPCIFDPAKHKWLDCINCWIMGGCLLLDKLCKPYTSRLDF